jgi:hypothetical protein
MISRIWSLSAGLDFGEDLDALTPVSKVVLPLPKFVIVKPDGKSDEQFVAKVAEQTDKLIGRHTWKEHKACCAQIPNARINRVFEVVGRR